MFYVSVLRYHFFRSDNNNNPRADSSYRRYSQQYKGQGSKRQVLKRNRQLDRTSVKSHLKSLLIIVSYKMFPLTL